MNKVGLRFNYNVIFTEMSRANLHILWVAAWCVTVCFTACAPETIADKTDLPVIAEDTVQPEPPLVRPPFAALDPPFQAVEVDPVQGGVYPVPGTKGSALHIPPGVLVDSLRMPLQEKVVLHYREFHDAIPIYLSGIPLDYDAAGILRRFETAGMFELRALSPQQVLVDSGKVISVTFGGTVKENVYPLFKLDEELTRNWHYMDHRGYAPNTEKAQLLQRDRNLLKIPLGPEYFAFNYMAALDVMLHDNTARINQQRNNPEMKTRVSEYGLSWSNIYNYEKISFSGAQYLASMLVWKKRSREEFPSWAGTAHSKLSHKQGNVYQLYLKDQKNNEFYAEIEAFMPLKSLFELPASTWKSRYEEALKRQQLNAEKYAALPDVYRHAELHLLGIYAFARFLDDAPRVHVNAEFRFDQQRLSDTLPEVYYLSGNNRSLLRFSASQWHNLMLWPDPGARLFAVFPDGRIFIYPAEKYRKLDFKTLGQSEQRPSLTFEMESRGKIESEAGLRELLGLPVLR